MSGDIINVTIEPSPEIVVTIEPPVVNATVTPGAEIAVIVEPSAALVSVTVEPQETVVVTIEGGAPGPQGPPGSAGAKWFTGSAVPSNAVGIDGDLFLHNVTGDVYIKTAGSWV